MKEKNLTAMECVPDGGVEQPNPILIDAMFEDLYRQHSGHSGQAKISLEGKRLTAEAALKGAEYIANHNRKQ